MLTAATSTSNELDGFLNADGDYLIQLAASSARILRVLADFSPEYPCLAQGLADLEPRLEDAFGGKQPGLHITLEFVNSRGKYVPGNEPQLVARLASRTATACRTRPSRSRASNFADGAPASGRPARCPAPTGPPTTPAGSARRPRPG